MVQKPRWSCLTFINIIQLSNNWQVSDGFDTIGFFNGSSRSDVSMSSEHGKLVVEFYSDASDVGTGFQATFREGSTAIS